MNKLLTGFLIAITLLGQNVEAGIISKTAKAYVAVKIIQKVTPIVSKKIADKIAKKAATKKLAQENGMYDSKVRESLQEVIKENKKSYPDLYKK